MWRVTGCLREVVSCKSQTTVGLFQVQVQKNHHFGRELGMGIIGWKRTVMAFLTRKQDKSLISPFPCVVWYPSTVASGHCQKTQYHRVWQLQQEQPRQELWWFAPSVVHQPSLQRQKTTMVRNKHIYFSVEWSVTDTAPIITGKRSQNHC